MAMRAYRAAAFVTLLSTTALIAGGCGAADSANTPAGNGECGEVIENAGDVIPEPPDGPSLCPDGACNYQTQAGCADGMACRPGLVQASGEITPFCQTAGSGTSGDACVDSTDCAAGYFCPSDQRCRKLCCGRDWSSSACDPGEGCYRELLFNVEEGEDPVPSGAWLCYPLGCDVLTSDECSSELDCKIIDPSGNTACVRPTPGDIGDPCDGPSVCGRGLSCVGDPGEGTCRRLCRAEACGEPACRPGEGACVHFNRDPDGVGECTPGWD